MPANYVLLEKITVGAAGAASMTFSNIPQTGYTDLKIVLSTRQTIGGAWEGILMTINGVTTNQSFRRVYGYNASTVASDIGPGFFISQSASYTPSTFATSEFYIPNYAGANYKSILDEGATENNASGSLMGLVAFLWSSTAPITSISIAGDNSNFVQYTTAYLYGVATLGTTPAISPYATGGDTIMTDGTYWYHAFKASGTFTPSKTLSCDVITVAGGGGGGGGGGGAGGLLYSTAQSFATAQTVTIGAGGVFSVKGNNSSIGSLVATAGGASDGQGALSNGGSGGGNSTAAAGGTGTVGQGNNGGSGAAPAFGGGGGAGAVGGNGNGFTAGAGGAGVNTYSSWLSATGTGVSGYIAGGGGGGAGNTGQGGAGGAGGGTAGGVFASANALPAPANTGGGGGGNYGSSGSNGGSGLVIVRYAV